jgi:hypothetical protein
MSQLTWSTAKGERRRSIRRQDLFPAVQVPLLNYVVCRHFDVWRCTAAYPNHRIASLEIDHAGRHRGKRVKIIGRIEIYKGKPEIRINAALNLPMV